LFDPTPTIGPDHLASYHDPMFVKLLQRQAILKMETNHSSSDRDARQIRPGQLLEPFGWAADALTEIVVAQPHLLVDLLEIDCQRMHLIALAFANLEVTPELAKLLMRGSVRSVTEHIPTLDPSIIEKVLGRHFPASVLERKNYQRLIALLADSNASRFLQTADYVSDFVISTLHGLPPPLRNAYVVNALDPVELECGFSDGLRFLVSRGAAPSFEALVSELAVVSEEEQLVSRIAELVETLPLPTDFPPPHIQKARRIDWPAEIRAFSETWNNALADYIGEINAGTCALYLWEDGDFSASCSVTRCGRLGWFLNEMRGPDDSAVNPRQRAQIRAAFDQAGFPSSHTIAAIAAMSRIAEIRKS
jgi:hypothetical protein